MDESSPVTGAGADTPSSIPTRPAPGRKRSSSGAGSLLSKLPFIRNSGEHRPRSRRNTNETEISTFPPTPSFTSIPAETPPRHTGAPIAAPLPLPHIIQHQTQQLQSLKTRRRRGSLRKVALLGRGAQREKRDRGLTIDTKLDVYSGPDGRHIEIEAAGTAPTSITSNSLPLRNHTGILKNTINTSSSYGLGISDLTPRPSMDGYASRSNSQCSDPDATPTTALAPINANPPPSLRNIITGSRSPSISYSTTDDEDALHMAVPTGLNSSTSNLSSSSSVNLLRPERASVSSASGSESYFLNLPHSPHSPPRPLSLGSGTSGSSILPSMQRRRGTVQRAKSPLALTSLAGLSTTPLPQPDSDWDYSETEWWGWVVLVVTWTVFVIGMGSCLEVWSWAWDVGTTPYAPPELEDDPTLPIVGYYPALIILSCVMAWVWVVVAWVGMKYFRHARVSGD